MKKELPNHQPIIYYDGECALCSFFVDFTYRLDDEKKFLFAPLQGDTAAHHIPKLVNKREGFTTVYLFNDSKLYKKSDAALLILSLLPKKRLKFLAYCISLIPKGLRDSLYMFISRNRRLLFPKPKKECPIPSPEFRARLLT